MSVFDKCCWVLGLLTLGAFGACQYLWPKDYWRSSEGAKYANPEAVEPSEDRYKLMQMLGAVGAVICFVGILIVIFVVPAPLSKEEKAKRDEEARGSAEQILPQPMWLRSHPSATQ